MLSKEIFNAIIKTAVESMGGDVTTFCTAGVQSVFKDIFGVIPSSSYIHEILDTRLDVVRLSGGEHYYMLPTPLTRYKGE